MSEPILHNCETCAYFEADKANEEGKYDGTGFCHRHPCVLTEVEDWVFPSMLGTEWCGEHSALQGFAVDTNVEGELMNLYRFLPAQRD